VSATACLNCGELVTQRFCPACGQEAEHTLQRPFREIAVEVLDETIALDSRFRQTIWPLLARPGFLTAEYLAGRKARYTSPLKLYLLASFVFFVIAAVTPGGGGAVKFTRSDDGRGDAQVQVDGEPRLRDRGWLGKRVADHIDELKALSDEQRKVRFRSAVTENAPRVVFFLVPVAALFLKLLYRRRYYAEHLVTSLHAHALAFIALLPSELLPWSGLSQVGGAATGLWLVVALKQVYGERWVRTVAKGFALLVTYSISLSLGLLLALGIALLVV
jgi:hypothetical protein